MHLVVGLGNPGRRYAGHRHNVGFRVIERLAAGAPFRRAHEGRAAEVQLAGRAVTLLEPLTYMNRSGESVHAAMLALDVPLEHVLVVHDELDLPFGSLRLKSGGGAAGHNGLKSIIAACGADFGRLRIGVGRPPEGPLEDWVLSDFDEGEGARLEDVLNDAARAARAVVEGGLTAAMNAVNVRKRD